MPQQPLRISCQRTAQRTTTIALRIWVEAQATFSSEKNDKLGDFELRAFVTTSVGSSDFKNTSYNVGVHWFGHTEKHRLVPTVGVGYTLRDFSAKGMKNINGAYFSLGLRF